MTSRLHDRVIAFFYQQEIPTGFFRLHDCTTAGLHDCMTAKLQNCKTLLSGKSM
jgi:hypothetical protein